MKRTIAFLEGRPVDHVPFHPLVMQYAAELTGVKYGAFCTDYRQQSKAMVTFARKYGLDWLHPAGWPYCEAIAYGLQVDFPEELLSKFPKEKHDAILGVLSQDPRPAYDTDETRLYGVEFAGFDVRFTVTGELLKVKELIKLN